MSSAAIGTKGVPRAEREEQIVAEAVDEFAASGYAGASMVEIARRAGISKPLIYQYFGSKDGLFLACLHTVSGGLLARLEAAELDVDDSVASRIYPLRAIFEALNPQPHAWRLLFDPSMPAAGEIAAAAAQYRTRTTRARRQRLDPLPRRPRHHQRARRVRAQRGVDGRRELDRRVVARAPGRVRRADDRALLPAARRDRRLTHPVQAGTRSTYRA